MISYYWSLIDLYLNRGERMVGGISLKGTFCLDE